MTISIGTSGPVLPSPALPHPLDAPGPGAAMPDSPLSAGSTRGYATPLLQGGRRALVRLAQVQDLKQTPGFLRTLSLRSHRRRFQGRLPALGLAALHSEQALADTQQVVLVAVLNTGHSEQLLADARFVCDTGGREAEFAIVVCDPVQRQGLGRVLLLALQQQAAERGVRWLRCEVQIDNPAMLCLLLSLGFKPALCDESAGLMVFEQRLHAAAQPAAWGTARSAHTPFGV